MTIEEATLIWIAALETEFATPGDLVPWVDPQIVRLDEPPTWMFDVSPALSTAETLSLIYAAKIPAEVWIEMEFGKLYLGFLHLNYQRGDFPLLALLLKAGDYSDGGDTDIECETFYLLSNEIVGRGPVRHDGRPLSERVAELFAPLAEKASHCWRELETLGTS